jgi:hypothetical protein
MKLKETAIPKGLKAQCLLAIFVAEKVFSDNGYNFVITSLNDSKHSDNSYHYDGYAFDVRVRNKWHDNISYPDAVNSAILAELIRNRLGPCYDVIYGDKHHLDHMHIEYNSREHE